MQNRTTEKTVCDFTQCNSKYK